MTSIPADTDGFRIEFDAGGIAHPVFQPAGGTPVPGARVGLAAIREKRAPQFGGGRQ